MDIKINMKIQEWIKREIKPNLIKTINRKYTSYTIKHICEKELGFYVSNEDIKYNMNLLGIYHEKVKVNSINYYYPISQRWFKSKKDSID
ncbi:hypothetical protein U728_2923 [Clostridium botulinum 202F]|nr:hypothetical protein U728_2923 [Clostridium botulinum 202F]KAI3345597.1 hypothetical protein CIT17_13410 [Clostridium botulinum]KON11724.1 hypothetical protein ACP50_15555 [Clostridium botulinum]MBY6988119.1 hypothetical protein [Clostridium botulinum]NFH00854.1 hypothetical protein [Clostridium botulinum]